MDGKGMRMSKISSVANVYILWALQYFLVNKWIDYDENITYASREL